MVNSKLLALLAAGALLFTVGCSSVDRVVYRPDINQGNYLNASELSQLHVGMNKEQVAYLMGTPMLKDPFGDNVWFYVFRQQPGHQPVTQQTYVLTFNDHNALSDIKKYDKL